MLARNKMGNNNTLKWFRRLKRLVVTALIGAGLLMSLLAFGERYLPLSLIEGHVCPSGYALQLNPSTNIDSGMHPGRSVTTISPTCVLENRAPVRVPDIVVILGIYIVFFGAMLIVGILGFPPISTLWNRYVGNADTKARKRRREIVMTCLQVGGAELILCSLIVGVSAHLMTSLDATPSAGLALLIEENPLLWIVIFFLALLIPSVFAVSKMTK